VKALGADRVIDYKKEDYKTIVSDLDIVFDTLGGDYTTDAFQVIKGGGRVTSITSVPDEETAAMMGMEGYQLPENFSKLIAAKSATYKLTWMQPNGEQLDAISAMVKDEKIKPIIDKVYAFKDCIEAYLYVANLEKEIKIEAGQEEVSFTGKIPAGKYDMEAQLIDKDGRVHPAYYIYIEKL
jgi:NADPH:quinone reductase-like Zn-dependent oxidoreductase